MTSSQSEGPTGQVAVRQAQFPGLPSSSHGAEKTTTAPRSEHAPPAMAVSTINTGIASSVTQPHTSSANHSGHASQRPGRKVVLRCFVRHLRANLQGEKGATNYLAEETDLPSLDERHHCCDFETMGTQSPTDLAPLHPNLHDPNGPDGVCETVGVIKLHSKSALDAEIRMRARAAAMKEKKVKSVDDDDVVDLDECVLSLRDPMSSKRMTAPGKSVRCEHIECFDLITFLRATLRSTRFSHRTKCADPLKHPKCHPLHTEKRHVGRCDYCKHWRCPICRKAISLHELEYDAFIGNVLEKLEDTTVERVKVKPSTGEWDLEKSGPGAFVLAREPPPGSKPPPVNDESGSEESDEDEQTEKARASMEFRDSHCEKNAGRTRESLDAERAPSHPAVIDLEDSEDEPEILRDVDVVGTTARSSERDEEEPVSPRTAPETFEPAAPASTPEIPGPESPRLKRPADPSPAVDPRAPKFPRRTVAAFAPMDPAGASARPATAATASTTFAEFEPPSRVPPAASARLPRADRDSFSIPSTSSALASNAATPSVLSSRRAASVAERPLSDPAVDVSTLARVGAVLKTVHEACLSDSALSWCDRASGRKSNEHRAVEQLTRWMEKTYGMTRALTHANREALRLALTRHNTGVAFQEFRKVVRQKRLLEKTKIANELRVVLVFMTRARDWWKAIVRKEALPDPLPTRRDGSYEISLADDGAKEERDDPEAPAAEAPPGRNALGAFRASPRSKASAAKLKAKREERAAEKRERKIRRERERERGSAAASPSCGGAKKFASNAAVPVPTRKVAAPSRRKETEKRRLPALCDARGHGNCSWDGSTPLKQHPTLKHVAICEGCFSFYHASHFNVGRDGCYEQCRCCSDGGEAIVCCDNCPQVFCRSCVTNLGGAEYAKDVDIVEKWHCFSCDPNAVAKGR